MIDTLVAASIDRDVVIAEGSDTAGFLHGQLSQDITGIEIGHSAWSLLLEPQGKVVALLRVTRAGGQRFLLDTDPGFGELVAARLSRFKLRTDCDLTLQTWPGIAWRGPGAAAITADEPIVAPAGWVGVEGVDVVGPDVRGAATIDEATFDTLRIAARWPRMGHELDSSTIPAAAGIVDRSVSFTKGCYTGQELVARIDSRGNNTPTRLVGVDGAFVAEGDEVILEGEPVGTITSASRVEPVALAYVKRAVAVPGAAEVVTDGRPVTVSLLP